MRVVPVPRVPAVLVVVLATGLLLGGLGWVVTSQVRNLVGSLPQYSEGIRHRALQIRDWASSGVIGDMKELSQKVAREIKDADKAKAEQKARQEEPSSPPAPSSQAERGEPARPVVLEPVAAGILSLPEAIRPFAEGLGVTVLVFVLVFFMLMKRAPPYGIIRMRASNNLRLEITSSSRL